MQSEHLHSVQTRFIKGRMGLPKRLAEFFNSANKDDVIKNNIIHGRYQDFDHILYSSDFLPTVLL